MDRQDDPEAPETEAWWWALMRSLGWGEGTLLRLGWLKPRSSNQGLIVPPLVQPEEKKPDEAEDAPDPYYEDYEDYWDDEDDYVDEEDRSVDWGYLENDHGGAFDGGWDQLVALGNWSSLDHYSQSTWGKNPYDLIG